MSIASSFEGGIESFPEAALTREELTAKARRLQWYHTLMLDDSLTTKGFFSLDKFRPYYLLPDSLEGLDCLDVGAGNGYWSFAMEERKAKSVTAVDIGNYFDTDFSLLFGEPPLCAAPSCEGEFGEPFRIAATLRKSKARYKICSVYDLKPETAGMHDLVFCGSMLMHLQGPQLAIMRMASICKNTLLATTQTEIAKDGECVASFTGHKISYVHFIPSPDCFVSMLRCGGFEKVLRGPTFYLELSDPHMYPHTICHTSAVCLKDARNPGINLPTARPYEETERIAKCRVRSSPIRVSRNEPFDVILEVANTSQTSWMSERNRDSLTLRVEIEAKLSRFRIGPLRKISLKAESDFPDYLPAGTSTLVRVRVVAPSKTGRLTIRPFLRQGDNTFLSESHESEVIVF